MQIDKDLLQYCKDNDFPIEEMVFEDFVTVQNSFLFNAYKLGLQFRDLGKVLLKSMKKIEPRNKSCKNFKCK